MGPYLTHSRLPIIAALLSGLACLVAFVASLPTSGHPRLSDYVTPIAVPAAWVIAIIGLASAVSSRRSASKRRYLLEVASNVATIVAGCVVWFVWPFLRAA